MAFTGKAIYDTGVWGAENILDVSPTISMISPFETPLLNVLGDPDYPAKSTIHEWMEEKLAPDTFVSSSTIPSSTTTTSIQVAAGLQEFIDIGAIVYNETAGEYLRVSASSSDWLTLVRQQGGTSCASVGAGSTFQIMDGAALEGDTFDNDISRPRTRGTNVLQIIKKDIIISGTMQAVALYGVENEFNKQVTNRSREALRDLEKYVIRGKGTSTSTLGSSTVPRIMFGLISKITTNVTTVTTFQESNLTASLRTCNAAGGTVDVIVASGLYKEIIDGWNSSRTRVANADDLYSNLVSQYQGTYGVQRVVYSRWMPTSSCLLIDSTKVKVLPLISRSFHVQRKDDASDATKGAVIGEYTVECRNEEGMAYIYA